MFRRQTEGSVGMCSDLSDRNLLNEARNRIRLKKGSIKAISYAVGFVSRKRPFSTEAQIGLSYAVEKGLYRLNFFD